MGFQRVVRPRFFIDMMSYLHATGHGEYFAHNDDHHSSVPTNNQIHYGEIADLLYCNTSSLIKFTLNGSTTLFSYKDQNGNKFPTLPIDCLIVLNHNLEGTSWSGGIRDSEDNSTVQSWEQSEDLISNSAYSGHNGFTIRLRDNVSYTTDASRLYFYTLTDANNVGQRYMGSYFFGKSFVPPHNPNLSMTVSNTFDGVKSTKTKGGHTISNADFIGNPLWSGHNAWELWKYSTDPSAALPNENPDATQQQMFVEDSKANLGRLGRRSWNFTFDFVSESDVFGALEQSNINPFNSTGTYPDDSGETFQTKGYDNPFLEEENFINRVWIPTLGGTIPMVMQVDHTNNNPDQFAIVTIRQNSFTVRPKAPNLYTLSMTLEETW